MQYRAVFLVILLATAGCATEGPGTTTAPGATATSTTAATTLAPTQGVQVTVTEVVDGDTIKVQYSNGTSETVRLVGVDTPEVHVAVDTAEFEGVPATEEGRSCLRAEAHNASSYTKRLLQSKQVRLVFDPRTDRRGSYGRLLAYVYLDGENFNHQLVAEGHARVYDNSDFSKAESFYAAEERAMAQGIGVWRCRSVENTTNTGSDLVVSAVHEDADGNDNENLNDEYVRFENQGNTTLDLTGWTVADGAGHSYTLDSLTLAPGEAVTLYTGSGTDTATERYWGADSAVWNNGGDTIIVRNRSGQVVVRKEYA